MAQSDHAVQQVIEAATTMRLLNMATKGSAEGGVSVPVC